MNIDFPLILLIAVVITGIISLLDILFWQKSRGIGDKKPLVIDYSRSFFPVLVLVIILRSFVFQFYKVPTGSLAPTIKPVEYIYSNQFAYGLRFPVWSKKIIAIGEPKRGDITLFQWPVNHKYVFIKRTVGMPGDKISYINKTFFINGVEAKKKFIGNELDYENGKDSPPFHVQLWEEDLLGCKHYIYINPEVPAQDFKNLVVPNGEYFEIGDNRDNSDDSRYWGFVKEKELVGKGEMVLLSWDAHASKIRWDRIGHSLTKHL
jgi:signal peptidase I